LSKLSSLKQEAYQAGKKRDWGRAVSVYEQILELDKNNPTVINELGDLCLKLGDTPRGVKHFLAAAAKYRQSGLLNNAVAIYKKILRYDEENQNAHWYLAESRANQGLMVEGEQHGLVFLTHRESLTGEIKEIFLKRCVNLFELYSESLEIQDNLLQVFRMWNMPQEAGRAQIQLGCLQMEKGDADTATKMVTEALAHAPELTNYPEHSRWLELQGPNSQPEQVADYDSVSLESPVAADAAVDEPVAETSFAPPVEPVVEEPVAQPVEPVAEESFAFTAEPEIEPEKTDAPSFGEVDFGDTPTADETFGLPARVEKAEPVAPPEPIADTTESSVSPTEVPDDSGCFNLDMGDNSSFDDLIAQASNGISDSEPEIEEFPNLDQPVTEETEPAVDDGGKVN